ncbi:DUF2336 domain-containing protein [Methylosinus sp. Ce-a6]|uniref:DUF2336 domain-containing protein n=1 Tax=Methylosinus sp. Ce-a6 TaxID=2172005 RepID=UPI00135C87CD|nr:DUF2336 domain-containing protein [Methylosinus sp. Ce-a6]
MIVRNFLKWAQTAPTALRVEGAGALARAYLESDLDDVMKREAETALAALLDDPSPLVRRALAKVFASSAEAPRSIVSALANDQSDIAAMVLSRSPLLGESELIDCAAVGDVFAQSAIALRAHVPTGLAAALAEIGACEAAISLAVNPNADLTAFAMRRMIERFGDDAQLREALLGRPFLPPSVRAELVEATAASLASFVMDRDWLSPERTRRIMQEARDKANVDIAASAEETQGRRGVRMLVAHLRRKARLTPSLALRALLSGNRALFEATLAELSGLDEEKVAGLTRDFRGAGFAALYARAGMPANLLPAYRAALEAQPAFGCASARLSLAMVQRVLTSCDGINSGELDRLMALLRRFEAEALREDAREAAAALTRAPFVDMAALEAQLLVAA